jgi:hypothetical protein
MTIPAEKSMGYGFLEALQVGDDFPNCDVSFLKSGLVDGGSRNLRNAATAC